MILLDQCVPNKFQRIIQLWGYQADLLSQHIAIESTDKAVIELAQKLDAVLLTIDLDFANILDYPPADYEGIVVMRYDIMDESDVLNSLKQALTDLYRDDLRHVLVIVEAHRYRIRKP
jgi:predicted nuclease of predicted toxin-antitoxin system